MTRPYIVAKHKLSNLLEDHKEKGQGTLEYVAMVVVAAIIVLGVVTYLSGIDLAGDLKTQVDKVLSVLGGGGGEG